MAKALHPLMWDWKGALHSEWYPFLFMLGADLRLSGSGERARDPVWLRKVYAPLLARRLLTPVKRKRGR
jgi:hypothetical protein